LGDDEVYVGGVEFDLLEKTDEFGLGDCALSVAFLGEGG
jgi:hypothetical protein